jgi:hypothetical protein
MRNKAYKKRLFCLLFLFTISVITYATGQEPDYIVYNGEIYDLLVNPLEAYFSIYPDKRPSGNLRSTSLWRGYTATFEIANGELYLKDIMVETITDIQRIEQVSVLREFLDGQPDLKIDWFSGLLVVPYGGIVNYAEMGYGSTYENYILLEIENGNFIRENRMRYAEYAQYRERQYQVFKEAIEYLNILKELGEEIPDERLDYFIKIYENDYTTIILK